MYFSTRFSTYISYIFTRRRRSLFAHLHIVRHGEHSSMVRETNVQGKGGGEEDALFHLIKKLLFFWIISSRRIKSPASCFNIRNLRNATLAVPLSYVLWKCTLCSKRTISFFLGRSVSNTLRLEKLLKLSQALEALSSLLRSQSLNCITPNSYFHKE